MAKFVGPPAIDSSQDARSERAGHAPESRGESVDPRFRPHVRGKARVRGCNGRRRGCLSRRRIEAAEQRSRCIVELEQ